MECQLSMVKQCTFDCHAIILIFHLKRSIFLVRHLDNLLLTDDGRLFHVDFGFILGRDPKPFPPPMKLCKEMVEAMGGAERCFPLSFFYLYFFFPSPFVLHSYFQLA